MNLKSLFPFTLRRILKRKAGVPDTWNSLIQLKGKHSFNPKVIFDIGAYKGDWTKMCLKIYPKSKFYLFENFVNPLQLIEDLQSKQPSAHQHMTERPIMTFQPHSEHAQRTKPLALS